MNVAALTDPPVFVINDGAPANKQRTGICLQLLLTSHLALQLIAVCFTQTPGVVIVEEHSVRPTFPSGLNVAVIITSLVRVNLQSLLVPLQVPPLHPTNTESLEGVAVTVTDEPFTN